MLSITIPGVPIALKRHRHTKTGLTYNPQRKEMEEYSFVAKLLINNKRYLPFDDPIKVTFSFFMPIPKLSKKIQQNDHHVKVPDIDNLIKFPLDALNGTLWDDDSIICEINASKVYSKNPRTEIQVTII